MLYAVFFSLALGLFWTLTVLSDQTATGGQVSLRKLLEESAYCEQVAFILHVSPFKF